MAVVRATIEQRMRAERTSTGVDAKTLDAHLTNLAALALHKAGVIKYEFRLSEERQYSYEQWRVLFGTVTEASASQLRAELKRSARAQNR